MGRIHQNETTLILNESSKYVKNVGGYHFLSMIVTFQHDKYFLHLVLDQDQLDLFGLPGPLHMTRYMISYASKKVSSGTLSRKIGEIPSIVEENKKKTPPFEFGSPLKPRLFVKEIYSGTPTKGQLKLFLTKCQVEYLEEDVVKIQIACNEARIAVRENELNTKKSIEKTLIRGSKDRNDERIQRNCREINNEPQMEKHIS